MDAKSKKELKKAYLGGKIAEYVTNAIMLLGEGEKVNTDEIAKELKLVEEERLATISKVGEFIKLDSKISIVDLVSKDEDDTEFKKWKERVGTDVAKAKSLVSKYHEVALLVQSTNEQRQAFSTIGHTLTALTLSIDEYRRYKQQQAQIRMLEIWTEQLCSRKEAEDYARATKEWLEYKNAYDLRKTVENIIVNTRKEVAGY